MTQTHRPERISTDADGDVAGEKRSSWHQRASAYVAELQAELSTIEARGGLSSDRARQLEKAKVQLRAARQALDHRSTPFALLSGSDVDRTWANIHRAEVSILKLASENDLRWWGTEVLARAKQHLGADDPLRSQLESQVGTNGQKAAELSQHTAHLVSWSSSACAGRLWREPFRCAICRGRRRRTWCPSVCCC